MLCAYIKLRNSEIYKIKRDFRYLIEQNLEARLKIGKKVLMAKNVGEITVEKYHMIYF